jgi:hypothetical protein
MGAIFFKFARPVDKTLSSDVSAVFRFSGGEELAAVACDCCVCAFILASGVKLSPFSKILTLPVIASDATSALPFKPVAPTFAVVLTVSPVEYPIHSNTDSTHPVNFPKLNKLYIKTQIINTINIPDMIDQILYPESASDAPLPLVSGTPESETEFDKKLNELVNGVVIDSTGDDSAVKLMIVIYIY